MDYTSSEKTKEGGADLYFGINRSKTVIFNVYPVPFLSMAHIREKSNVCFISSLIE